MTVIDPADGTETANAVRACVDLPGPVYIRIGRGFEPPYYESADYGFEIGKAHTVRDGTDLAVITCGIGVLQSVEAARTLQEADGLSVRVINMHTIKPIDREAIMKAVTDTRRIITVEEHNTLGGLGSAVADERSCDRLPSGGRERTPAGREHRGVSRNSGAGQEQDDAVSDGEYGQEQRSAPCVGGDWGTSRLDSR